MKLDYQLVQKDQKRFVYLSECGQRLDAADLWQWMKETRDEDPELYAQLVHAYVLLTKSSFRPS
jgi:hypothetical protein